MVHRNSSSHRRSRVLAPCALSCLLLTGCTNAVFDAVAAGTLNFIQTGVMTTLSSAVFGGDGVTTASTAMDGMTMSDGGEHDTHDG